MRKVIVKRPFQPFMKGYFHTWGMKEICENGIVTCGIVESEDGEIHTPEPYNIRFVEEFPEDKLKTE